MAASHGMDPREVRAIATLLSDAASQLHDIGANASTLVERLEWQGPDVRGLQEQWRGSGRPQLDSAASDLTGAAKSLAGQVDQQDEASAGGSGPGGSGLPDLGKIFGRTFVSHDSGGFFGWLGDTAGDVWDGITDAGHAAGGLVSEGVSAAEHGLSGLFHGGLSVLGHGVNFVGDLAGKGLSWTAGAIDWGADKLGGAVSGVAHGTGWLLGTVGLGGAGDFIGHLGDHLGGGISSFGHALPRVADNLTQLVHTIGDPLSHGQLPTVSSIVAGGLLVAGSAGGALSNLVAGKDLHVLDDGVGSAGTPKNLGTVPAPTQLADLVNEVSAADAAKGDDSNVRVTTVDHGGAKAYIVSVPGTSDWNPATGQRTLDLTGNLVAVRGTSPSAAMQGVEQAMANAGIPPGAPVMLVGHSQGGIITSQLVSDPAFMGTYNVTNMMTYGSPIDTANIPSGVHTLALQHTTDVVPRLDLGGLNVLGGQHDPGSNVTTVTLDNVASVTDVGGQHAGAGYARSLEHPGSDAPVLAAYANDPSTQAFLGGSSATAQDVPITRKGS